MAAPRNPYVLTPKARKLIGKGVEAMFERLKGRYLGPKYLSGWGDKQIVITASTEPTLSLQGVYEGASRLEGVRPDDEVFKGLADMAEGFLDAIQERTKAQVLREVQAFLQEAKASGIKTDVETVLGGKLSEVMGKVTSQVHTVLDAETAGAKNMGLMDGITKINAHLGIDDPLVYFMVVHDNELCKECKRLHLLEDGVTPRVWRLSEVKAGYHKKGEDTPSLGGLHPHCRCTMGNLMPGYGFDASGMVTYISPDWDEYKSQRLESRP